jgi:hypothetical protein
VRGTHADPLGTLLAILSPACWLRHCGDILNEPRGKACGIASTQNDLERNPLELGYDHRLAC